MAIKITSKIYHKKAKPNDADQDQQYRKQQFNNRCP